MAEVQKVLTSDKFIDDEKLQRCAQFDVDHLGEDFNPRHPSVRKIQEALEDIMAVDLSAENGRFGRLTGDAVEAFKRSQTPPIVNFKSQIDRVVGKQTIRALDLRLRSKLKVDPGDVPIPPLDPFQLRQDIFVYFLGAPPDRQGTESTTKRDQLKGEFNTPEYLKTHQPLVPLCFFGGRGNTDRSSEVVQNVLELRRITAKGVTIVRGDSVGGLIALRAANKLFQNGIRIDYLAIDDAAFFADLGEVASFNPIRFNLPQPIVAERKENFFQVFGHEILVDSREKNGFMKGAEFHGPFGGFFRDLNTADFGSNTQGVISSFNALPGSGDPVVLPLALRRRFSDKAHDAAHADADPKINAVVKSLIRPEIAGASVLAAARAR